MFTISRRKENLEHAAKFSLCPVSSLSTLEFLALRMVSEDQQCAGWLEVFYNGTWGSVCRSPMEDITVSVICRQLGCGTVEPSTLLLVSGKVLDPSG